MNLVRATRFCLGLVVILLGVATPAYAIAPLPGTPEVDPGSMVSALALLTGGFLMLTDRFGSRK